MSSALTPDTSPRLPPPGEDAQDLTHSHRFDAVRVASLYGIIAISHLRLASGPVIEELIEQQDARVVYWFVPPGSADSWDLRGVQVLKDQAPALPPVGQTGAGHSLYWLIPPVSSLLTNPLLLWNALAHALDHEGAHRG